MAKGRTVPIPEPPDEATIRADERQRILALAPKHERGKEYEQRGMVQVQGREINTSARVNETTTRVFVNASPEYLAGYEEGFAAAVALYRKAIQE